METKTSKKKFQNKHTYHVFNYVIKYVYPVSKSEINSESFKTIDIKYWKLYNISKANASELF